MKNAFAGLIVFMLLLIPAAKLFAAPSAGEKTDVHALIDDLASDDPATRQHATDGLVTLGGDARDAVLAATKSDDPSIRTQAAAVLLQLPWFRSTDSADVQNLLHDYGTRDTDGRRQVIAGLATAGGFDALIRLMNEEPSDDVRWSIVFVARQFPEFGKYVRKNIDAIVIDPPTAPTLAMLGWTCRAKDREKSNGYFKQVVDLEAQKPTSDMNEMLVVFGTLQNDALGDAHPERAAELLRQQAGRASPIVFAGVPMPIANLFALHADFGPLPGYEDDQKTFAAYLDKAPLLYAIGRVHEHKGEKDQAQANYKDALAKSDSLDERWQTIVFLVRNGWSNQGDGVEYFFPKCGWNELAETELKAVLESAPAQFTNSHLSANAGLAAMATHRHDDEAAAQRLEAVLKSAGELQGVTLNPNFEKSVRSELEWRKLRVARAANDEKAIDAHLNELIRQSPENPDMLLDIFPTMIKAGRQEEADQIFGRAYATAQAALASDPENPEKMNNIAWLCARAGRKVDDAIKNATAAIDIEPDNPAYLDTAAEANFLNGNREQAVKLETRALVYRPYDNFMREQLERFKTAEVKSPATLPAPYFPPLNFQPSGDN